MYLITLHVNLIRLFLFDDTLHYSSIEIHDETSFSFLYLIGLSFREEIWNMNIIVKRSS